MTGLLDTHSLIWLDQDPGRLSPTATAFIQDPANVVLLSAVSVWEMAIKVPTGKLVLPDPIGVIIARQLANNLIPLPINLVHALVLSSCP